jgi:ABC-type sugar transport system substrate-binding protein
MRMKAEAAKQGVSLVSLDPRQSVATEFSQVEDLITKKVDLIIMIPVDVAAREPARLKNVAFPGPN